MYVEGKDKTLFRVYLVLQIGFLASLECYYNTPASLKNISYINTPPAFRSFSLHHIWLLYFSLVPGAYAPLALLVSALSVSRGCDKIR